MTMCGGPIVSNLPALNLACLAAFFLVNVGSFLFSYMFLVDADSRPGAVRMQMSILIYGGAQSLIGYLGGFYTARLVHAAGQPRTREYEFVKSDDDILD